MPHLLPARLQRWRMSPHTSSVLRPTRSRPRVRPPPDTTVRASAEASAVGSANSSPMRFANSSWRISGCETKSAGRCSTADSLGHLGLFSGWALFESGAPPPRSGTIPQVTSTPAAAQHLRDLARLRRVRDRIDREYAQPLDVAALASGANMSAGHLSREFRLAYGEAPYGYLMTRGNARGMALLRRGDLSVTEVCFAVGCQSLGTFSTRFTELVGMPPSNYRRARARARAGMPPCVAKQVTRPIRNREALVTEPQPA